MRFLLISLILMSWGNIVTSCAQQNVCLKIGVLSDIHYLSPQLMDGKEAAKKFESVSGRVVTQVPQILEQVLNDYLASDIEILLIAGDLTNDGEKQSHIDLVKTLKPLMDRGIKIYVIPGNHDINRPNTYGYKGENSYHVENISPSDFALIYADCGYKDAIKRDQNSLSYVVQLDHKTWLLAIDSNKYKEYTDTYITSGGKISPETETWIEQVMEEANGNNIQVIGMMHHSLVEHIAMQATFFKDYIVDDWQRLAPRLANLGLKAIFTGHFHANDVTEYISKEKMKIYDIETGSLAAYPFPYRFIELDREGMKISTKNITSTLTSPQLSDLHKKTLEERTKSIAIQKMNQMGISFPIETKESIADIAAKVFVLHAAGDEKPDDELKTAIGRLSNLLGSPIDVSGNGLGLDFYPADNNVEIKF